MGHRYEWSDEKARQFKHAGRLKDPYELAVGQEAAACEECHALYQEKRWFFDEDLHDRLVSGDKVRQVICPACQKIKDRYAEGYVTLSGDFLAGHKDEIVTLLEKEAAKVGKRNVLDRIIRMVPEADGKLVVETTTEKLAQHLGRAVHKAYKGDLAFQWSEPNPFVRVYWSRS